MLSSCSFGLLSNPGASLCSLAWYGMSPPAPPILETVNNKLSFDGNHLLLCWPHYPWILIINLYLKQSPHDIRFWLCIFHRDVTGVIMCSSHCILSVSAQVWFVPLLMIFTLISWLRWCLPVFSIIKLLFILFVIVKCFLTWYFVTV